MNSHEMNSHGLGRTIGVAVGLLVLCTALACGSDVPDDEVPACGVGDGCSCMSTLDCPDPFAEQCVNFVCTSPTDEPDADASEDSDSATDTTDTRVDQPDRRQEDPEEEVDGREDADDTGDGEDADEEADEMVEDLVEGDADVEDEPDLPPLETNWVAFESLRGGGLTSISFVRSDGTGEMEYVGDADNDVIVSQPAFSQDGSKLAVVVLGECGLCLRIHDFSDDEPIEISTGLAPMSSPSWFPDGERIAIAGRIDDDAFGIWIIDIEGAQTNPDTARTELTDPGTGGSDSPQDSVPRVSSDGSQVFFQRGPVSRRYEIYTVNVENEEVQMITTGSRIQAEFALSPDDNVLVWSDGDPRFETDSVEGSGEGFRGWPAHPEGGTLALAHPSFFPDGRRLTATTVVGVGEHSELVVLSYPQGELLQTLTNDEIDQVSSSVSALPADDIDVSKTAVSND